MQHLKVSHVQVRRQAEHRQLQRRRVGRHVAQQPREGLRLLGTAQAVLPGAGRPLARVARRRPEHLLTLRRWHLPNPTKGRSARPRAGACVECTQRHNLH